MQRTARLLGDPVRRRPRDRLVCLRGWVSDHAKPQVFGHLGAPPDIVFDLARPGPSEACDGLKAFDLADLQTPE